MPAYRLAQIARLSRRVFDQDNRQDWSRNRVLGERQASAWGRIACKSKSQVKGIAGRTSPVFENMFGSMGGQTIGFGVFSYGVEVCSVCDGRVLVFVG